MLSATLTTKNGNSSQFSQPIADSSKKCSLSMLHEGLINMKEDLNQILTALVESEKNNDGSTDAATYSNGNKLIPVLRDFSCFFHLLKDFVQVNKCILVSQGVCNIKV